MPKTSILPQYSWRPALVGGLLLAAAGLPLSAAAQRVLWADAAGSLPEAARATTQALSQFRTVRVQLPALRSALATAPAEAALRSSGTVVSLPLPDGSSQRFRVARVPVMHPALAARYPQISTYEAQGIDDPAATARLDVTPAGFHAMIQAPGQTVFIDPATDGSAVHLVFSKASMSSAALARVCLTTEAAPVLPAPAAARFPNGATLRTYRLAMACTGEYTATKGGTRAGALAGIVASVNRVSGVYEKELAIRLVLVPNTDSLIYLNAATDPYTNQSNSATLNTNQIIIDQRIGTANYDIGHIFNTASGGIAGLGVVCRAGQKARGTTGLANPTGDAFDIDFVAHEIGHQFGGAHTFNGSAGNCAGGNRSGGSAYEPGSGTTIMAYAGICGAQNLQSNSDPYFHTHSFDQILTYASGPGNCSVNTATGNRPPVVNAGPDYRIPISTPFELTGSATDADGDALTYSWEQLDLGAAGAPTEPVGNAPLFRVFSPVTSPSRVFPRLPNLLANTAAIGEILPSYGRRMAFRLVARDNRVGGGGVDYDSMSVAVVGTAGPFLLTLPNTAAASWQAGAPQQVAWNVANTTAAPISAANVDILLSTDGGQTFPTVLLANTPNDGYEAVTVPVSVAATATARLKVKAAGNVFFDLSNQNFAITNSGVPTFFLTPGVTRVPAICPGAVLPFPVAVGQLQSFSGTVALSAAGLPAGVTVSYDNAAPAAGTTVQATLAVAAGTPSGTYTIALTGTSGTLTQSQQLTFQVLENATIAAVPVSPISGQRVGPRPRLSWNAVPGAASYELQVSANEAFSNVLVTVSNITGLSSTVGGVALTAGTTYYWRVRGISPCGVAPYSVAASFLVGPLACATVAATQVPVNIPFGATPTVTSVINVQNTERVGDIRLRNLAIAHQNIGELTVSLTNPAGRTVVLLANVCPGTTDLNLSLNDAAATAVSCPLTSGATYRPANPLAPLLNDQAAGNWTLTISDNNASNGGQLTGWGLELCTLAEAPAAPTTLLTLLNGVTNNRANVNLVWLDNSSNETGFQVERTGANNTTFAPLTTVAANATFYADQIAGANGTYCYRVRAINATGTTAYTNESCVAITTLSSQKEALLRGVEVYPNPSTGQFRVSVDNSQRGAILLRVTDALGRTVSTEKLNKGSAPLKHALDLGQLSTGVYQLHLDMPEGTAVVRLLKQ